ncbi:MAG: hypothetical protein M9965_08610 [Anaerolineae bacterium]|nr:hypothetical protein [Anaerolineae bacterium]MCO5193629.1 hypothetical protein [Anaerolineae bacterium]
MVTKFGRNHSVRERRITIKLIALLIILLLAGCRESNDPVTDPATDVPSTSTTAAQATATEPPAATNAPQLPTATSLPTPTTVPDALPTATPVSAETPTQQATPPDANTDDISFANVAVLAVPTDAVYVANADEIRAAMRELKALDINIIFQLFPADSTVADWRSFLDIAAEEGMLVDLGMEDGSPRWNGADFDLGPYETLLRELADHPALYAVAIIDEPYHKKHNFEITTDRLQLLYRQSKALAPDLPVHVGFSREIWKAAEGRYGPEYSFAPGLCDICAVSTLEFRNYGDGNFFDAETALNNHLASRETIRRLAPDSQIWTTVQAFGSVNTTDNGEGGTYYMPSADELQEMLALLFSDELQAAGALDGVMWQQWASRYTDQDSKQYTLSDPEFAAHRELMKQVGENAGFTP